ncbi:MAG TPA: protein kinase, partial [Blastocatellia bacterium]|nr:protein kinase [Blastocatellia bacterium]
MNRQGFPAIHNGQACVDWMTPERYQLIDQIFQAALELDPQQRPAFLDEACSNDGTLRSEVESLLTSDREGLSFIDNQVLDLAAPLLAQEESELVAGELIDRYEILSLLGSGAMGEVYLAHDERLKRRIAFKLLPHYLITNQESLHRFQQEARAASALNHPNIITIYEIGQVDHRHFIATEFVDGQTVRQRLKESAVSLQESLEIAIQICRALSAAHQAGIIHRDIKPENIMLRRDGYVKVLDFGLAKLTEQREQRIDTGAAQPVDLSSGLLMGTVKYMSPEQARGLAVDQRSDIFSIGVVLYEMITGRVPFDYKKPGDLISLIKKEKPLPLKHYSPAASDELQQIIDKALHKERDARYQTANEIMQDLLRLKERSTGRGIAYLTDKIKQHGIVASVALLLMVIGLAASLLELTRLFKGKHIPFKQTRFTKLTNFGDAWLPAISPDGKYVAYVKMSTTAGQNSLWLRAVGTTNERILVTVTDGFINGTKFLPDSEHVAYETDAGTFVVPTSGGEPTKLPTKGLAFSPDSRQVAYLDNRLSEGKTVLVVSNADGTGTQDITTRQAPNYYWTANTAAWSPDGKLIACIGQNGNEGFGRVFVIDVDKRTETSLTAQKWNVIFGITWLPDMSGL